MRKVTMKDSQATPPDTAERSDRDVIMERPPLPYLAALGAEVSCVTATARLLRQRRIHLPAGHVGARLHFTDGTSGRVYRETVIDRGATASPCVLVVEFRLRAVRGRGHALFRWESLLNTPLFAGFPAWSRSCGWPPTSAAATGACMSGMAPRRAEAYARALWRVLALVSVPGSIHYVVLPGLSRDELLARPQGPADAVGAADWWRLAEVS